MSTTPTDPIPGHTPLPTWRVVHDPEEIHQYCGFMAVLAGCGPSRAFPGKFWWNVGATPVSQRVETKYADTISEARALIEKHLEPYIARMNPEPRVEAEPAVPSLPALLAEREELRKRLEVAKRTEAICHCGQPWSEHTGYNGHDFVELKECCPYAESAVQLKRENTALTKERDELKAEIELLKREAGKQEHVICELSKDAASERDLKIMFEAERDAARALLKQMAEAGMKLVNHYVKNDGEEAEFIAMISQGGLTSSLWKQLQAALAAYREAQK